MITWSSNSLLQEKDIRPYKNHAETSEQNRLDLQLVAAARELKSNCSQQSATTKLLSKTSCGTRTQPDGPTVSRNLASDLQQQEQIKNGATVEKRLTADAAWSRILETKQKLD